jgi:hypothetical protein
VPRAAQCCEQELRNPTISRRYRVIGRLQWRVKRDAHPIRGRLVPL